MTLSLHFLKNVLEDWLNTRASSFMFLFPIGCCSYFGWYLRENQDLNMKVDTAIVF